ncbi:restriction endonuclease subunit S [Streptococcus sp. HMSC061D10]|uniref:restriction endonuclease subunit S n=1 Tax=Streptococcus sp. HMSC061D10 TaxID=1715207 RepID=UPI0008B2D078|nr:restriction endonuclease subunit S [Streptococcus sp. HMSC061D10]OFN80936.1 restriction endonuclease subunit S [Streptococcus sp. HMSC061D10]
MSKLEECILGDLVEFQRGYDLPKSKFVEGKYPVQSSNGILGYHNEYKVEGPGITIGRSGTVGNPHLIRENFFPHNTSLFVKEFKGNDIEYIYYLLQYLDLGNQKSGSGVPTMNRNHLHPIKVRSYRDKTYQQRTIKILSLIDKKIQINNQINQELEAMAKTLYDYWFVQFDFPDQNGKPYKSSGGKMVYNPELKREIPEGWGVTTFSSWISDNKTGDWGKETSEGNYTLEVDCIRGADINGLSGNGKTDMPTRFILEKNKNKLLTDFDIVIEISGGSPTQSTGRIVGISENVLNRFDLPLICSNFCKAVSLKEQETFYNFVYEWKNLYDNGVLFSWEGKTSGIKNLLFDSFVTNYHIAQPPIGLMEQFFDYAYSVDRKIQLLLKQNQELTQLRDWLLPMLMNGQVKVENYTD